MANGSQKVTTYSSNTLIPKLNSASLSNFTDSQNLIYTYYGGDNSIGDKPTSVNAFGVMSFKTAADWYGQLLMSSNQATGLYWRTATSLSGGWCKLLDSSNYTDYTVTKTGTGASGTWSIDISGNAATSTSTRYIQSPDTRSTNPAPSTFNATNGVSFDFKQGSVIGLTSANYSGVMSYRPYASGTDWSGGNAHQIAFNNAGLYWRQGGSSWGNWTQIVTNSGTWSISINGRLTDSAHSWTATEVYNYMTARVLKAGDTMTGQLYINYNQDVGLNQNGSLIIGAKGGENIGIDGNEIMARSNSAASTLYLNSEGGNVYIGSGGVTSVGTITSSAGYLRSTCNGNTVTIGSQNTGFTHITSSATRPFWFNNDIQIEKGKIIGGAGTQYRPYQLYLGRNSTAASNGINSANPLIEFSNADRSQYGQLVYTDFDSVRSPDGLTWVGNQANSWFQAPRIFGAVWNDYAEYRETKDKIQPGRCVVETGYGDLILSTARLQPGCEIVSDTFGFAIGETDKCKTPTACAGRVLAYLYEDKSLAKPGDPVCSGPNGTVSIMTHEEEIQWPSRIIATISEIPDYEEWEYGSADEFGNKEKLKVDGRIWIRVR